MAEPRDPVDIVGDFEARLREADELLNGARVSTSLVIARYLSAFGHLAADLLLNEIESER